MRPALAPETLLGAALTGRASRSEGTPRREGDASFAGLLDGARQQQGGRVYDGSAFDVPEAKPISNASRNGPAAEPDRRLMEQRQLQARHEARRESDSAEPTREPTSRAAEAKPATPTGKTRAPDAPRETGRAPKEAAAEGEVAPEQAAAGTDGEGLAVVAMRADGEPAVAATTTTQDWMARWASLSGSAMQTASAEGDAAMPTNSLQRLGAAAGEPAAALAANAAAAPQDATAPLAGASMAGFEEARAEAAAPAPIAAVRIEAPIPLPNAQAAAPAASAAPAAAAANLPVPLDAPDFSQALGWQLATLARDGVHEAQLQLNPVEMGPVQVQILLDGGQAQIDFTAAQARTREVLEAGWPALAAAMHSAGFTLGGGGVFEQRSQEQGAQGQGGGMRSRQGNDEVAALVEPGVTRLAGSGPRSLLDLYA